MIAPCEIQPFHPFAPVIRIVRRPCKSQHLRCLRHPVRCGRRRQGQLRCPHSGAGEEGYEMGRVKVVNTSILPFMREMPGSGKLLEEIAD